MYVVYFLLDDKKDPFYVGISKNPKGRVRNHIFALNNKKNKSVYHLPVYNKIRKLVENGMSIHDMFYIKEEGISNNDIDNREKYWISKLQNDGYKLKNLTEGGRDSHLTDEIQRKAAKSRTGQKRSKETRKKMSEARKGMEFSEQHKKNLSIARRKRKTTKETRKKMSESAKGKINIKVYKLVDPDGKVWATDRGLTCFCEEHNLSAPNMHKVISGKRKHHKGWTVKGS